MKILAISGGTKDGNNDSICKEALMAAQEEGAEVEFIRLLDLNLKHCTGCGACMRSLNMGKGGGCPQKDDFNWLRDRVLDADGLLFSIPVFEKGAAGVFHTFLDRFGPGNDYGTNWLGRKIARETGGKEPDARIFRQKPVVYFGTGGTDYVTRFQCDCSMLSTLMMWHTINCEVFDWISCFEVEDERIARVHAVGKALAAAARAPAEAPYLGAPGVCPQCRGTNFYLRPDGTAECCLCGVKGHIEAKEGELRFVFPQEQLALAYNTLEGKLHHAEDIRRNHARRQDIMKTSLFQERKRAYKVFLSAEHPEPADERS